jgi:uncharacterized membrane protein YdbT with pleckstrin-like domain
MVVLQPGERVVCEMKRHPFGIVSIYAGAFVAIVLALLLAMFVPNALTDAGVSSPNATTYIYLGVGVLTLVIVLILLIATTVYWQNRWVITTDSITQITQNSLFGRQVSQLSMENLEDVTVDQSGILPHMFNYGTLKVETAGERSKFLFVYCPNPNLYARQILDVHEKFLEDRRNIQQLNGHGVNTTVRS